MKILPNDNIVTIEKVSFQPKLLMVLPVKGANAYSVGRVTSEGVMQDRYFLYPSGAARDFRTANRGESFVYLRDILCEVAPDDDEQVVNEIDERDLEPFDAQWR